MNKPKFISETHLQYLDNLYEQKHIKISAASAYIEKEFEMESQDARKVLLYWISTYGQPER
jgi:hypothetical protein